MAIVGVYHTCTRYYWCKISSSRSPVLAEAGIWCRGVTSMKSTGRPPCPWLGLCRKLNYRNNRNHSGTATYWHCLTRSLRQNILECHLSKCWKFICWIYSPYDAQIWEMLSEEVRNHNFYFKLASKVLGRLGLPLVTPPRKSNK